MEQEEHINTCTEHTVNEREREKISYTDKFHAMIDGNFVDVAFIFAFVVIFCLKAAVVAPHCWRHLIQPFAACHPCNALNWLIFTTYNIHWHQNIIHLIFATFLCFAPSATVCANYFSLFICLSSLTLSNLSIISIYFICSSPINPIEWFPTRERQGKSENKSDQ